PYLEEDGGNWERKIVSGTLTRYRYRPRVEGDFSRIYRVVDTTTKKAYWEVTTADNVTHVYGRSAQARVADPSDSRRVFRWLLEESRDDRGNVILYRYKEEDLDGVPRVPGEMHRHRHHQKHGEQLFANRYLKRIWYGNRAGVADPSAASHFHYEVVFDYGEHDASVPTPDEATTWPARQDPFSLYRAGFEIRTYRLCRRVLMFH